jgi:predicted nucleic acid-binding Zn ribbon protein
MFCKNCGQYLPDNVKFCSKCGTPTNIINQNQNNQNINTSTKKKKSGCLVAFLIFILALALIIVLIVTQIITLIPEIKNTFKQEQYAEVIKGTDNVKKAVEKCISESLNINVKSNSLIEATTCNNNSVGITWKIKSASDYKTKDIDNIKVVNGKIIATAVNNKNFEAATYVIEPYKSQYNGVIMWLMNTTESTCLTNNLCEKQDFN